MLLAVEIPDATDLWQLIDHVPAVIRWMALLAAALTAASIIRHKLIMPSMVFVKTIYTGAECAIRNHQICAKIAEEFGRNSGSTLRDTVDRIEALATTANAKADMAASIAVDAATLAKKAAQRADEVHEIADKILTANPGPPHSGEH
jgi:uncharacterized protein DUF3359